MSLARTALRLAVIEALKADATVTALCQDRIYDSLIEEFDSTQPVPMIVVLTEQDGGKAFNPQNGGLPFDQVCELTLEIACRQIAPDDPNGQPQIAIPQTDRELEANIDLLEQRAVEAITIADTPQSRLVRQAVTRRVTKFSSVRFASDQTGVKLAVRELRLTVELKGETPGNPLDMPAGPFALLPDPLRTVATAMLPGSSGLLTCQMIAAAIQGVTPAVFSGVDATYAFKRPAYPAGAPLGITDANRPDPFGQAITITQGTPDAP